MRLKYLSLKLKRLSYEKKQLKKDLIVMLVPGLIQKLV